MTVTGNAPAPRLVRGTVYGAHRARVFELFVSLRSVNAQHVARCLGITRATAGPLLVRLAAAGQLIPCEYTTRRPDGLTTYYTMRGQS